MKGKLILIPLKEPKEGMKVVYKNRVMIIYRMPPLWQEKGFCDIKVEGTNTYIPMALLSELQQIAIEYKKEDIVVRDTVYGLIKPEILPLHPDDYEKALPLIGKEVEFFNPMGSDHAELVEFDDTPTPVMYTEEEAKRLCLFAAGYTRLRVAQNKEWDFDDWWNENKKK